MQTKSAIENNKTLILLRGLPGSGKSTFAQYLVSQMPSCIHHEADHYFIVDGEYKFDVSKLSNAHIECQFLTEKSMAVFEYQTVIVSNTFSEDWELEPYFTLASKYGYTVTVLIVENYHGNKSVHNVPDVSINKMKYRFNIQL